MTVDFAKEYLLDDCDDCPENENGECMTQSHCFEIKRMAIQALEQTRWIPVSEKFPEESGEYLISINGGVTTSWFYRADGVWSYRNADITAWMPLPQPYKGESEDEE